MITYESLCSIIDDQRRRIAQGPRLQNIDDPQEHEQLRLLWERDSARFLNYLENIRKQLDGNSNNFNRVFFVHCWACGARQRCELDTRSKTIIAIRDDAHLN